jgi:hypothetical protein
MMPLSLDQSDRHSIIYRIDERDRLSGVNEGWSDFARENQGETLTPDRVLGRTIWDSIADDTVKSVYQQMIRRVRSGKWVRFVFRCDAPAKKRTFEMSMRQRISGEVEFISTLVQEEARPSVAVLEPGRERSEQTLQICGWCQKAEMPDHVWLPVEEVVDALQLKESGPLPRLTYGICQSCASKFLHLAL